MPDRTASLIERLLPIDPALAREVEGLAAELESTRRALENAKRLSSSVIQNISHEVRTPVTIIRGLLGILAEDVGPALTDDQRDIMERVRHSSQQVLDVIQGLLDLSKAGAGMVEARRGRVYFPDLVADLVREVEVELQTGVRLVVDVPRGIDWLSVDGLLLKQVGGHLLSNAAKFTARGEVRLLARLLGSAPGAATLSVPQLRAADPAGDTLEIRIEDTGEGIPAAEQELIFEAFRQVDSSRARKHEGLGIGLTSAREMAKFLGASIEIQSEPGQGTRVRLLVPLFGVEAPAKQAIPPPPARIPAPGPLDSRGVLSDLVSLSMVSPASDVEAIAFVIDFVDRLLRPEVCLYARRGADGGEEIVDILGHGAHGLAPGRRAPLSAETLERIAASRQAVSERRSATDDAWWLATGIFAGRTERAGTLAARLRGSPESDGGEGKILQIAGAWLGRELERARTLREQSEILATVGRDVKTPLGSLLAHTQALLRGLSGPLAAEQRPAVLELERTIHRVILSALDLLDYQRQAVRGIEVSREPFSLAEVIAHVLSRQGAAIELAAAAVERRVAADLPRANGDLIRTDRACAIVFRSFLERLEAGRSITVAAFAEPGFVCLELAAELKDVAPFLEIFGSRPAPIELGATLGLRLARGWVEAQGGRVGVRQEPHGLVVRLDFPLEAR